MISFVVKALQPGLSMEGGLLLLFAAVAIGLAVGVIASILCAVRQESKESE